MKNLLRKIKMVADCFIKPVLARLRSGEVRRRSRYARYYKYSKIQSKTILYEAFYGRGMLDNPYAIFLELMSNPEYSHWKHIWVLDEPANHQYLIDEYKQKKNVKFIKYQSRQYLKTLCKAGYLINNSTFPTYYTKKEGQVYVNTWHGIPLKKLGFAMENGRMESHNVIRNFLQTDYILSANPFLTKVFRDSYMLEGIYQGRIIEEGYPRMDLLLLTKKADIYRKLKQHGVDFDPNKKIILYAPTWKGQNFGKPDDSVDEYKRFCSELSRLLISTGYQILVKPHQATYDQMKNQFESNFVPPKIDANELLSVVDVLICDYSSIYFDYLLRDKPILFYIPDISEYQSYRGLYFTIDDLPGPYTTDVNILAGWINELPTIWSANKERFQRVKNWCIDEYSYPVSKNIVDIVFHKRVTEKCLKLDNSKKSILFHRGEMRVNGISSSFKSLLDQIEYDKYDVTAAVLNTKVQEQKHLVNDLNSHVRVLSRNSTINLTLMEEIFHLLVVQLGLRNKMFEVFATNQAYRREFIRSYGLKKFDYVIDFDGYNLYYDLIHLHNNGSRTAIWQHNDMVAEQKLRFPWIKTIFTIYPKFDHIISCSKAAMEVNRASLATVQTNDKFTYATNTLDLRRPSSGLKKQNRLMLTDRAYCAIETFKDDSHLAVKLVPLEYSKRIVQLTEKMYTIQGENILSNGIRNLDLYSQVNAECTRFVSIGRLSPEKNHESLIKAFKMLLSYNQNCMLYIIGEGPLHKKLQATINQLGLTHNVILVGNLKNPFELMQHCHCFILPSLHEGQGLVVLEARLLGLPIIISNFKVADSVSLSNGQLVIGKNVTDIYNGMKAFLEGKVPSNYIFNAEQYNNEAYQEFLSAIGETGKLA